MIINILIQHKKLINIVSAITLVSTGLWLRKFFVLDSIFIFLEDHPILAPVLFVTIFVFMMLLVLPTLPLNLGAGFLWGPYWGGLLTVTGVTLGAAIAFLFSRYLAAEILKHYFKHRMWTWLLDQVSQQGWRIVAFTRINPIFPTALLNYFYGFTTLRFFPYLICTALFIAPSAILFAYIGYSFGSFVLQDSAYHFVKNIFGISVLITIIFSIRFYVKRFVNLE